MMYTMTHPPTYRAACTRGWCLFRWVSATQVMTALVRLVSRVLTITIGLATQYRHTPRSIYDDFLIARENGYFCLDRVCEIR